MSFSADDSRVSFRLDLAAAYPPQAEIANWTRTLTLVLGKGIELSEDYQLKKWIAPFELNFMTTLWVKVDQPGKVLFADSASGQPLYVLGYNPEQFEARAEDIPIEDTRLKSAWGNRVARIILKSRKQATAGNHSVAIDYYREN